MNMNSRFAGVSRAAKALLRSTDADAVAIAEEGGVALNATDTPPADTPAPDPSEDEEDAGEEVTTSPEEEAEPNDPPAPAGTARTGDDAIRADERARVATVFASEHATGRERQAADMLQTSMSATEITGLLAKAPKGGAAADPMLAALAKTENPNLGASADEAPAGRAATDSIWDKAREMNARAN